MALLVSLWVRYDVYIYNISIYNTYNIIYYVVCIHSGTFLVQHGTFMGGPGSGASMREYECTHTHTHKQYTTCINWYMIWYMIYLNYRNNGYRDFLDVVYGCRSDGYGIPIKPFWLQCDCHHTGLVQYFVAENDFTHWLLKIIKGCHWNKKSPKFEIRWIVKE